VGNNASLELEGKVLMWAMLKGVPKSPSPWCKGDVKFIVTVPVAAAERVTAKFMFAVPEFPSARLASAMETVGTAKSSLTMVPTAVVLVSVAPQALERTTLKVSLLSMVVSPKTGTRMVPLVCPWSMTSTPPDWV